MTLTIPELDSSILDYLKSDCLMREGHFAYPSGRHSAVLLDFDLLLADPGVSSRMGYALAKAWFTAKIDTVAAPSIWGAGLAQWVAYFLEPRAKVVYATPLPDGSQQVEPNLLHLVDQRRILLIDNVIRSGQTVQGFSAEIAALGGEVLGIGCLWGGAELDIEHDVVGLLNDRYPTWDAASCPLCQDGDDDLEILPT